MIQGYLTELCRVAVPNLRWSTDFYALDDKTGTVYAEAGSTPSLNESDMRYPAYMVYIRSKDFDEAKQSAHAVFNALHKQGNFIAEEKEYDSKDNVIGSTSYRVFLVAAYTEPIRLGAENNVMRYSINFDVTLRKIEEEL